MKERKQFTTGGVGESNSRPFGQLSINRQSQMIVFGYKEVANWEYKRSVEAIVFSFSLQ